MSHSTRRGFLKVAAAGTAAAGVATVVGNGTAEAKTVEAKPTALPKSNYRSIVAHIDDVRSGEMTVMVEGRAVTVTDHDLVARIAQALHSASAKPTSSH